MASSIFRPERGNNSIFSQMDRIRSAAGGNLQAACDLLDSANVTRTLPDGRQVSASQFVQMMRGKTPEQGFREMGVDPDSVRGMI